MEILTLLKMLPAILLALFYALWKWEKSRRKRAEQERDNAEASYELAGEVAEIKDGEGRANAQIRKMSDDELANAYHTGVRDLPDSKV